MSFYDNGFRGIYQTIQQRKQDKINHHLEGWESQPSKYSFSSSMYSLNKAERLCSKKLIDELLLSKCSFVKYPFRVIFKISSQTGDFPARIAISVSKKKFKRAVKRNRIKRLTREVYRLNKIDFYQQIPENKTIDILFIYLDYQLPEYHKIEKAIQSAMQKIQNQLSMAS